MNKSDYIFGIRAIIEAIESGNEIDKILVKNDLNGDLAKELMEKVRQYEILIQRVPVEKLNRITRKNHQGVIAFLSPVEYYKLGEVIPQLYEDRKVPFLMLLDGLTDTRNFGAIARTASCANVDAIVIPQRNSVSVTADSVKTSAGALMSLPVCRERSILDAVRELKSNGIKVIGASEKVHTDYTKVDMTCPVAIVMGSEDTGIRAEVLRECDEIVAIPMFGPIGSLNVSVAAGLMMYEVVRQRINEGIITCK
ncbi:MAG: 23S rRNA (guanosine(2251)-2'-O)-methyltransferase RlmB [Prevotella sp.]|nr:23S rRNA (guanosine(2251)-2'-O)-methyltransferase RlmB [Bacteroides sp.]MCM1365680.1 23S rRNA (guanosine(2251)-2'-O)-methyltransferase RlmB [Prevotella sp.]MCM1437134.1 23S rRNA (guanosine(2251)-2'-O)-methyltransferase RlmB [Prevotella sp.]